MSHLSAILRRGQRLSARAPKGIFRFLSVGMVGLATHTAVFTLLFHLGAGKSPAWLSGLALGTLVTWRLNRRLTFVGTGRRGTAEMARYVLVTAVCQTISYCAFVATCALAPKFPPSIAVIVGAVLATAFSYSGQRFFTFAPYKPRGGSEPSAAQEAPAA